MLSHLCCSMNVDVMLLTVILHHVNPCFLGSSLTFCYMHISVDDPFFAHDQNTAFAVAVCDLPCPGRPPISHRSIPDPVSAILLKQDISNISNLFSCFLLCLGENEHGNGISGANFCIVFHFTYGSILFTFRNMTTGRTTDDGLTDRRRQETHIWPLRRACRLQRQL